MRELDVGGLDAIDNEIGLVVGGVVGIADLLHCQREHRMNGSTLRGKESRSEISSEETLEKMGILYLVRARIKCLGGLRLRRGESVIQLA